MDFDCLYCNKEFEVKSEDLPMYEDIDIKCPHCTGKLKLCWDETCYSNEGHQDWYSEWYIEKEVIDEKV